MNAQLEGAINIAAAILLLFTAMLDPRISVALAVNLLIVLGIFQFASVSKQAKR